MYYSINENLARLAKTLNSFYDYKPGSATEEYKQSVDKAAELAEARKLQVLPEYHEKINNLLDYYAKKLADWINKNNNIESRVPSVLICGSANFPTRKKEKQNQARARHWEEYKKIAHILEKIKNTGFSAKEKRRREQSIATKHAEINLEGWAFEGGEVVIDIEDDRLRILFDTKPDDETRTKLKKATFKWAPSRGVWQRQLTQNAVYAAKLVTDKK